MESLVRADNRALRSGVDKPFRYVIASRGSKTRSCDRACVSNSLSLASAPVTT